MRIKNLLLCALLTCSCQTAGSRKSASTDTLLKPDVVDTVRGIENKNKNLDNNPQVKSGAGSQTSPANKLLFLARRQQNYILEFAAIPDPQKRFQIIRHTSSNYKRLNFIMRIGETSSDKMFRIDSLQGDGSAGAPSTLSITFSPNGRSFRLKKRVKLFIPTYFAQFKLPLGNEGEAEEFYVKEGDTFRSATYPDIEYRLIEVTADKATVSFKNEEEKEVKLGIKIRK